MVTLMLCKLSLLSGIKVSRIKGILLDKDFEKIYYKTLANGNRYIYLACPIPLNILPKIGSNRWLDVWLTGRFQKVTGEQICSRRLLMNRGFCIPCTELH